MTLMLADSVKRAWGMQKINDTEDIFFIRIAKAQQKHKSNQYNDRHKERRWEKTLKNMKRTTTMKCVIVNSSGE